MKHTRPFFRSFFFPKKLRTTAVCLCAAAAIFYVVNYPAAIKSFYMKQNPDGKTVAATDLLVPTVGEIIGCSERETDLEKLTQAMIARNMPLENYKDYLDTRKYGTVEHSGFGLGFDRMVMYITGIGNIRDVLQFPRAYKKIY